MPVRPRYDRLKLGFHGQDGGAELDGGQPGRLLWRTGPPPSTVAHPTVSMGVTNGATLAAASTHDTQTHHLPPTLYEEPFHPCNICTGVPPTLKRPAPTRVVLGDPQTTNTSTRGCSMCPGWGIPVKQPAGAGHGVGRLGPRSGRNCLSRGAEGPSWGRL